MQKNSNVSVRVNMQTDRYGYIFRPAWFGGLIAVIFVAVYLLPLGNRPLLIPDEARYSQIPREMISSGNYFAPTFAGMPYYEKPSGGYYPEILAQKILGESNFTTRIPYVVAAAISLLLTYLLATRSRDDREHLPYLAVMMLWEQLIRRRMFLSCMRFSLTMMPRERKCLGEMGTIFTW